MSEEKCLRICKICKLEKPLNNFNVSSHQCKPCLYQKNKEYHLKYYETNRERLKTRQLNLYHTVYKQEKEAEERKPRGRPKKYVEEKNI